MNKLLLSTLIAGCLFYQTAESYTQAQLREQIRHQVLDTTDTVTTPRWSDAILNTRMNLVQDAVVRYALPLYGQTLINPTTGQAEYSKPSDCITIDRVSYKMAGSSWSYRKLENQTIGGLDRDESSWEKLVYESSGAPQYYIEKGDKIIIKPAPSLAYSWVSSIKIQYYKRAAEMDDDADEPYDSVDSLIIWHDLIITGVVAMCIWDERDMAAYQVKMGEYTAMLELMKRRTEFQPDLNASMRINTP